MKILDVLRTNFLPYKEVLLLGDFSRSAVFVLDENDNSRQSVDVSDFGNGLTHKITVGQTDFYFRYNPGVQAVFHSTDRDFDIFRPLSPTFHSYTLCPDGRIKEQARDLSELETLKL